jgi:Zn-dependent protease
MILQNFDLLTSAPAEFVRLLIMVAFGLIIAITVHEFSHAYVAHLRGDETARMHGRVSLNPLAHLDWMGTLMLFVAGFGWGKPVPVDSNNLRAPVRLSWAAVSVAGVFSNLLLAAVISLPIRLGLVGYPFGNFGTLLAYMVQINIVLAVFNLIPFPPLDGFNILSAALPANIMRPLVPVMRWGPFILFGLILIDNFSRTNVLATVIGWPVNHLTLGLLGLG